MNDPATEGRYTIGELAERADVTSRTIRYYTSEGVLPPPDLRGKYALYSDDHLRRLLLIKQLKDAFLPLQEIRARLDPLSPAEVTDLLGRDQAGGQPYPMPAAPERRLREESSAADYISQLLSTRRSAGPAERAKPAPPGAPPPPAQSGPAPAAPPAAEAWQRIPLAPGLELHARQPLPADAARLLETMLAAARPLLEAQEDTL